MSKERTRSVNARNASMRAMILGRDAREELNPVQISDQDEITGQQYRSADAACPALRDKRVTEQRRRGTAHAGELPGSLIPG